ncbi:flagellar export chaperone FliS [Marinobacterium arenosum]|uniref:flagellar export chaperone FliS n=1 Tax=Marinobacterium arenosum TaxID=2862496 RepID=UPI001C9425E2|nr:flagellar export chaperone FliS [Marinobacterium arenosum]MBY4675933.1 flagellar export chaperone FliS [Marinobacterium arenosum]
MSINLSALKQYQSVDLKASVATASPHKLILMLFNGALEALAKARGAIERNDIEGRTKQLNKSTDIVMGLRDMLDHEKGGEVAANLDALYDYIVRTMLQANRENSAEKVQEVMDLLLTVKQGWEEMPDEHKQ